MERVPACDGGGWIIWYKTWTGSGRWGRVGFNEIVRLRKSLITFPKWCINVHPSAAFSFQIQLHHHYEPVCVPAGHIPCPSARVRSPPVTTANSTFFCTAENWRKWFKQSINSWFLPCPERVRTACRCLQPLHLLLMRGRMLCGWGHHSAPELRGPWLDPSLGNLTTRAMFFSRG